MESPSTSLTSKQNIIEKSTIQDLFLFTFFNKVKNDLFFVYFKSFLTSIQFLQQIKMTHLVNRSGIRTQDMCLLPQPQDQGRAPTKFYFTLASSIYLATHYCCKNLRRNLTRTQSKLRKIMDCSNDEGFTQNKSS